MTAALAAPDPVNALGVHCVYNRHGFGATLYVGHVANLTVIVTHWPESHICPWLVAIHAGTQLVATGQGKSLDEAERQCAAVTARVRMGLAALAKVQP